MSISQLQPSPTKKQVEARRMDKIAALGRKYDLLTRSKPTVENSVKMRMLARIARRNGFQYLGERYYLESVSMKARAVVR